MVHHGVIRSCVSLFAGFREGDVEAVLMSHYLRSCALTLALHHCKERTFEHSEQREALAQGSPHTRHRRDNTWPGRSLPTLRTSLSGTVFRSESRVASEWDERGSVIPKSA
jgi:hypothetical protein